MIFQAQLHYKKSNVRQQKTTAFEKGINNAGLLTGTLDWEYWEAVGDFGRI